MRKSIAALAALVVQGSQHHSYRSMRAFDISIVFAFTIFIQDFFRYPRAGWTGFAVMMIYAGFDNGTTLFRAYHRFLGVFIGIFLSYILWFIGHLDYRLLILVIPTTVFLAYFLIAQAYSIPTVFMVTSAIIGTGYFDVHNKFPIVYYLVDYGVCTLIAFGIIWAFETFWFGHYHMMLRFITNTQADVITKLIKLINILTKKKISRSEWFSGCITFTQSLFELNNLIQNAQFKERAERVVGHEFTDFIELTNQIFIGQKALYFAHKAKRFRKYDYDQLFQQVHLDLEQLKKIVDDTQIVDAISGVIHEAPN